MKESRNHYQGEDMLAIPAPLSRQGRKAAAIIKKYINDAQLQTGGCKTFYSPKEWQERGEKYGTGSELVVVYDGGDLYSVMSGEFGYEGEEEIGRRLEEIGVYLEPCTSWCAAVYVD